MLELCFAPVTIAILKRKIKNMEALFTLLLVAGYVFLNRKRFFRKARRRPKQQTIPSAEIVPFDASSARKPSDDQSISGRARIIDGDTLVIAKTQLRLFGVDAPEIDHPYGQKAKWALVALCKGQTVHARIRDIDDYGRTVALCTLEDGRDLSAEMVKQGLAIDWPKFSGGKYGNLELPDARKKLWLADARQKGHMHVWRAYEARKTRPRPKVSTPDRANG